MRYEDNTAQVERAMREAMLDAIQAVAEDLLEDANDTIPVDTGRMLSEGQAGSEETTTGVRAVVSYGNGDSAAYTVRQHEDLSLNHSSGQRAMWLTYAARENQAKYAAYLAGEVKKKAGEQWL